MDDNKSKDEPKKTPWGQLAEDLGAKPSTEAFERSQPPAVEIPAAEAASAQEDVSETPQQTPSDWNALAGSLGLEPSLSEPEPSPPEAKTVPDPVKEVAARSTEEPSSSSKRPSEDDSCSLGISDEETADPLPPLPSEVDQIMSEGEWEDETSEDEAASGMSGDVAKNAFDALFDADGSALSVPSFGAGVSTDSTDTEGKANDSEDGNNEDGDSEDSDKEERPKRRRSRRRGRGRGRGRKTEAEQTPSEEVTEAQSPLNGEDRKESSEEGKESSEEETSEDGEKPRRRRPRRRSRRSASEDNPRETDDSEAAVLYKEDDLPEGDGSSPRDSIGHRNMPTWAEALSVIIEGNLELHSKTPSRQSSSRGRGRGRGGRGRKKT